MEDLRAEQKSRSPKRKRDGKDNFFCGRVRRNPQAVTIHRGHSREQLTLLTCRRKFSWRKTVPAL